MNKKTDSFTISEILIVLIITAIIVGITFSVLALVRKEISKSEKRLDFDTRLKQTELKLTIDFNRFRQISIDENSIYLKNELDSIQYDFNNNVLTFEKDTLLNDFDSIEFMYRGEKANKGYIDGIKINVSYTEQSQISIFVYKLNDASEINNLDGL